MVFLTTVFSRGQYRVPPAAVLKIRMSAVIIFYLFSALFSASAVSAGAAVSQAGEIKDDYAQVEMKRQKLEKQRIQYEVVLRALTARRISLNRELYRCISQKWDPSWEAELEEAKKIRETLETERLRLADLRVTLDKVRMELEISRIETERFHKDKGPASDYEKEIRNYMDDIMSRYFDRLEKELFPGYKKYLSGIEKYFLLLKRTLAVCVKHRQTD
ncbi:MAG: hypothetical protein BWK80_15450 [Desulfobacteraceae bacterium IS3]|nr:MAG: hypothetical protein BWK80_15450 [Desulfobacteraceae bacterium IS3]